MLTGALAVAAIVLVQGSGVAQSAPNPGGAPSDANRDFVAQGVGNVASSLIGGQPVGGSVGQTALNVASGARTRWAAIFSGMFMLLILVAFSSIIGKVAQPTLAGLLIVAGIGSISPGRIITILRTGAISQIALITTFIATLLLPVAAAVGIGVALSLILQLNREALDLKIVELVPTDDGLLREQKPPTSLTSRTVTMLDVYGSLLYAGSRTLQVRLPDPGDAATAAVIIRLRGRTQLGATFFQVVDDYALRLSRQRRAAVPQRGGPEPARAVHPGRRARGRADHRDGSHRRDRRVEPRRLRPGDRLGLDERVRRRGVAAAPARRAS